MNRVLFQSSRQDWCTPESLLKSVREFGEIGLDPCSNKRSTVGATTEWRRERGEDGLRKSWKGHGLVFVNPPYGARGVKPWVEKAAKDLSDSVTDDEAVVLVYSRTDVKWFQQWGGRAGAICFIRGRITFVGAAHGAPAPSCLLYFGPRIDRFCEVFSTVGLVFTRRAPAQRHTGAPKFVAKGKGTIKGATNPILADGGDA